MMLPCQRQVRNPASCTSFLSFTPKNLSWAVLPAVEPADWILHLLMDRGVPVAKSRGELRGCVLWLPGEEQGSGLML